MRTESQREASRRNGAKSRGPRTVAGKRKSSRNSCRHGLFAKTVEPPTTPQAESAYAAAVADYAAEFQPATAIEHALVEMAAKAWCNVLRAYRFERTTFNEEIARQRLTRPDADFNTLLALAFCRLADETRRLQAIRTVQNRALRHYNLAIHNLERQRDLRETNLGGAEKTKMRETNPTSAEQTEIHETNPSAANNVSESPLPDRASVAANSALSPHVAGNAIPLPCQHASQPAQPEPLAEVEADENIRHRHSRERHQRIEPTAAPHRWKTSTRSPRRAGSDPTPLNQDKPRTISGF